MAKTKDITQRIRVSGKDTSGELHNLGGAPDRRQDVQDVFNDLGFVNVTGTNGIDTAVLGSYAYALKSLEDKYGAIHASENPHFTTGNGTAKAAVIWESGNPLNQDMAINSDQMGTVKANLQSQRSSEASGWHTTTDGKITSQNGYTVRHEYGHMLSNALAAKQGMNPRDFSNKSRKEIEHIARTKYGAKKGSSPSRYGKDKDSEFFAESFASLNSGNPNAYGKAMGDWLKKNKL